MQARTWFEKAISAGDLGGKASNNMGNLYRGGFGVPKDLERAHDLYERAAADGSFVAIYNLGTMFERGEVGGQKDIETAKRWLEKSAAKGHEGAKKHLAEMAAGTGQ